jgi:hypothetical protein
MSRTIAIDFDGVIHSYTSPWQGPVVISDPPVPGALDAVIGYLSAGLNVIIFSTRCSTTGGVNSMKEWFQKWEFNCIDMLEFTDTKPTIASLFIDDRGYHFTGTFPSVEFCKTFKPWNKK